MNDMTRIAILMYHGVAEPRAKNEVRYACAPDRFEEHMAFLCSAGHDVISLDTLREYLDGRAKLGKTAVLVTLDDGYGDNYENAFPILRKHRIPAAIFLVAGFAGKTSRWGRADGYAEQKMLDWGQVREMRKAGITLGSHTLTHPRLPELPLDEARGEIEGAKQLMEDELGETVEYFAYPYGRYNQEIQRMVEEAGYSLACSTRSGFNNVDADKYALRRIEVQGGDSVWKLKQKLNFGVNDVGVGFLFRYYLGRAKARVMV